MGPKEFPPNGGERWNPEMGIFEMWNPTEKQRKALAKQKNTIWNKVTLSTSEKIDDRTTCVVRETVENSTWMSVGGVVWDLVGRQIHDQIYDDHRHRLPPMRFIYEKIFRISGG